jgi:acetylcholinesterase
VTLIILQFNATFPNLQTFPKAGVFHSSEIRLVFGTYAEGSKAPSPPEEVALSEFIQGAWARFAKDPWSGPGWTAVGNSPSGNDLGDIGSYGETGVRMIRASDVDKRCGIYTPLYKKVAGL